MNDFNLKTWALVLILAMGTTFEIVKRLPKTKLFEGEGRTAQSQPFAIRGSKVRGAPPTMLPPPKIVAARVAPRPAQLPALTKEQVDKLAQSMPKETEFDHGKPKVKKKLNEDEWEIVVDPVTGKRIKRKKKKVAKKEEKKEEVVKTEEKPSEDPKEDNDEDIDRAIAQAMATGQPPASNTRKPDEAFASAEDWMRKLLSRPDLAETKRFIEHYNKALLSPEVFYRVVHAMLVDSREKMKQLGVLCLGSTPSPTSFQMLAQTIAKERSGSAARNDAEGFADKYKEYSKLGILDRVLRGGMGTPTTVLATQKLEVSATENLGKAQSSTSTGATNATNNPVRTMTASYKKFEPILTNLTKSNDPQIKAQAASTLNVLQNLLGSSGGGAVVQPAQASN